MSHDFPPVSYCTDDESESTDSGERASDLVKETVRGLLGQLKPLPQGGTEKHGVNNESVGGGAEDFADFAGEVLQGERFLQKGFVGVGFEGGGECVFGVAGEVKDFYAGTGLGELLNEFVAAEAGHDDICDDKMNGVGAAGGEGECGVTVAGFEDVIAAGGESFADELADGFFVFDEEDGF